MKKILFVVGLVFLGIYANFKDKEKDPLHKKIFITTITEIKENVASNKNIKDELEFKDGKLYSNFLNDKFNIGWIKYTIQKDTSFVDSISEIDTRYFEIIASFQDEDKQITKVLCKINNEYIEGEIKISKNDKPKKNFEFSGIEKATKIKDKNKK